MTPLLSIDISVHYGGKPILDRVCLDLRHGEAFAVLGQSGSGKTTLALAIPGLIGWQHGKVTGSIRFKGRELVGAKESELRRLRGKEIGLVLQSASSALNPALRLETQFREAWGAHSGVPWRHQRAETLSRLSSFGLPANDEFLRRLPREISIGQAQRVLIAMALLHHPAILVADEPTSALDPLTAKEVIDALRIANQSWNTALIYITHNVATAPGLCSQAAVMRSGRIIEQGVCAEVFTHPQHEYTRALLAAISSPPGFTTPLEKIACLV
jgi:ABC-type glutathione transport system ATPase component